MIRGLLVEDDPLFADALIDYLAADPIELVAVRSLAEARAELKVDTFDVVVLDQQLPDGMGLDLAPALRGTPILVITAHPELGDAVEALRLGIRDFLVKPIQLEELRLSLFRTETEVVASRREKTRRRLQRVSSPAMAPVLVWADRGAKSSSPMLITGETGTGKGFIARLVHRRSARKGEFVPVNCAALPESLVEAELFGTSEGAFTGARAREGLFELASGGTLFLDEIGELPRPSQAKLLDVLESQTVRRVGDGRFRKVDVRIIAATNRSLAGDGFRRDLFYRLSVVSLEIPPLRERPDDLPALVDELLADLAPGRDLPLAPGEMEALRAYSFPGNVRELRNCLERAILVADGEPLRPSSNLRTGLPPTHHHPPNVGSPPTLETMERDLILQTLDHVGGHREKAAKSLGISVATLRRKLHRLRALGYAAQIERTAHSERSS
ncbi:MAG: sigma-54 dependent transcriptional regulator [Myxococcota bacterium]